MANVRNLKKIGFLKGFLFYAPVLSLYFLNAGVHVGALVFAQMMHSIAMLVVELPTGLIADRYGQRVSLIIGYALQAVSIIVMFIYPTEPMLYAAFLINGVAISFQSGSEEALFYDSCKSENVEVCNYKKEYGRFLSNQVVSFGTATLLTGLLIQIFGETAYPMTFIMASLSLVYSSYSAKKLIEPEVHTRTKTRQSLKEIIMNTVSQVKKEKAILAMVIVGVLTVSGQYFLSSVYAPYFVERSVPPLLIGVAVSLGSFLSYFTLKNVHKIEHLFSIDKAILCAQLLLAVLFTLLGAFIDPAFVVVTYVLLVGSFGIILPLMSDFINEYIDPQIRSSVLSTISLARAIGKIFIRFFYGVLVGIIGVGSTFFVHSMYLVVGGILTYIALQVLVFKPNQKLAAESIEE